MRVGTPAGVCEPQMRKSADPVVMRARAVSEHVQVRARTCSETRVRTPARTGTQATSREELFGCSTLGAGRPHEDDRVPHIPLRVEYKSTAKIRARLLSQATDMQRA
eukprot:6202034-Pleurochrysis_carterae.AAC.1